MSDAAWQDLLETMAACRRCPGMTSVPGVARGAPDSRVMVVGQAPAKTTGSVYLPFGNPGGGKNLFLWLADIGWDEASFRRAAYFTAVVKCYPGPNPRGKGDRPPAPREVANCRPFLAREQALLSPRVLVPVGGLAVRELLGPRPLTEVVGRVFSQGAATLIPLPHPSGANLWNNDPAHRELRRRAVGALGEVLTTLGLHPRST